MTIDETYMHRCIKLAELGGGNVLPNPMVGAVLVHEGRIIGEGYHERYGQAHAEVNCINSVKQEDEAFIENLALYVSLEPCAHFGKTPPCADLIIKKKIRKVVIGCRDPFEQVNGKGIEKLQAAGVDVTVGVLEAECKKLNKRFFIFHTQHRPFIILKWAQTANGKIATSPIPINIGTLKERPLSTNRLFISNDFTNRFVHKWRSEEAAILVGTNTVFADNPSLTNRLWTGKSPVRLVADMELKLPSASAIFNKQQRTIVFNSIKHEEDNNNLFYYQVSEDVSLVHQILNACYKNNIQSILVEGGGKLLQSFIDKAAWDEARIITNEKLFVEGVSAPQLTNATLVESKHIFDDRIDFYATLNK